MQHCIILSGHAARARQGGRGGGAGRQADGGLRAPAQGAQETVILCYIIILYYIILYYIIFYAGLQPRERRKR